MTRIHAAGAGSIGAHGNPGCPRRTPSRDLALGAGDVNFESTGAAAGYPGPGRHRINGRRHAACEGRACRRARGFKEPEVEWLARLIADVLDAPHDGARLERIAEDVRALCARFPPSIAPLTAIKE